MKKNTNIIPGIKLASAATTLSVIVGISSLLAATNISAFTLNFNAGVEECIGGFGTPPACNYGIAVVSGSYFGLDINSNGIVDPVERVAINQFKGLIVDGITVQTAYENASGGLQPAIDNPWIYFNNPGLHLTTQPVTVVNADVNNDGGLSQTLNFDGWAVIWGENSTTSSLAGAEATLTCSLAGCPTGSNYSLDYNVTIGAGIQNGFFSAGVYYSLHLEGTVASSVPTIIGDMNGDGILNVVDVLLLQRAISQF